MQSDGRQHEHTPQNYHSTYRSFPVGMLMQPGLVYTEINLLHSLVAFLEEQALYDTWNFKTPASNVSTNANRGAPQKINSLFCPSDLFESNPSSLPGPASPSPSTELARHGSRWYAGTGLRGETPAKVPTTSTSLQFAIRPRRSTGGLDRN